MYKDELAHLERARIGITKVYSLVLIVLGLFVLLVNIIFPPHPEGITNAIIAIILGVINGILYLTGKYKETQIAMVVGSMLFFRMCQ